MPGRPTIWITVGQGPTARAGLFGHFQSHLSFLSSFSLFWGWSGGAMMLGKLPVPGRPTIWIQKGKGLLRSQ